MKTTQLKPADVQRKWIEISAEGQTLGKLSVRVADILRGKNKPTFTSHVDGGDYVIVTNCEKIVLTGDKLNQKKYYNYSGFQSGLRTRTAKEMVEKWPEEMVKLAIKGMLPKNKLNRQVLSKLHCYRGSEHKHAAQTPEVVTL